MRLPDLLTPDRTVDAVDALHCYYARGRHRDHNTFTGARFDAWGHTGGGQDAFPDRFTADDLVAVSMLGVYVPARAAVELLQTRTEEFTALLQAVGPDRDLVTQTDPWEDGWAGWKLWSTLMGLDRVGATTASKLYARKRPKLRPIYDSVVARIIHTQSIWEPLRAHLQASPELHPHLLALRERAGLPEEVSALRVFDVVAWMEGKRYTPCRWA